MSRAKILFGIAISVSWIRLMAASIQPPEAAATRASTRPAEQASRVPTNATPMV
ncbi:hypothetical protein D9M68_387170 [compost metagenome]